MMGISQTYPDVTICSQGQQRESQQTTESESPASTGPSHRRQLMPNSSGNFFIASNSSSCPVLSACIAHTGLTLPAGASEWNQAVCGGVRQFRAVDASEFRRQFLHHEQLLVLHTRPFFDTVSTLRPYRCVMMNGSTLLMPA